MWEIWRSYWHMRSLYPGLVNGAIEDVKLNHCPRKLTHCPMGPFLTQYSSLIWEQKVVFWYYRRLFHKSLLSITRPNSSQGTDLCFNMLPASFQCSVTFPLDIYSLGFRFCEMDIFLWTCPKNLRFGGHFWLKPTILPTSAYWSNTIREFQYTSEVLEIHFVPLSI